MYLLYSSSLIRTGPHFFIKTSIKPHQKLLLAGRMFLHVFLQASAWILSRFDLQLMEALACRAQFNTGAAYVYYLILSCCSDWPVMDVTDSLFVQSPSESFFLTSCPSTSFLWELTQMNVQHIHATDIWKVYLAYQVNMYLFKSKEHGVNFTASPARTLLHTSWLQMMPVQY